MINWNKITLKSYKCFGNVYQKLTSGLDAVVVLFCADFAARFIFTLRMVLEVENF